MAPREELVTSAVSFLQDPTVAAAPLSNKIAFLKSKNLTQEEIDLSLARAGAVDSSGAAATTTTTATTTAPPANYSYRPPPPPPQNYAYPPAGYWQQPPAPEPPKRDWRDYFIMATVMGGVGYGLYFTAKRYIVPLIAPPTPPQIEQDKSAIDAEFTRAFALLDKLSEDTGALKAAEESQTQRLDTALEEVEALISSLKDASRARDADQRRLEDDVRGLRDLLPKALDAQKENADCRLRELSTELKSLKTLVQSRLQASPPAGRPQPAAGTVPSAGANAYGSQGASAGASAYVPGGSSSGTESPGATVASNPYARLSGKAAIPAWQMAARKGTPSPTRSATPATAVESEKKDVTESGTVEEASPAN